MIVCSNDDPMLTLTYFVKVKEFLAIRRAISLNKRSFYFVEITTPDTRHT